MRLERLAVKVARAVLRGRGAGNSALLPDTTTLMLELEVEDLFLTMVTLLVLPSLTFFIMFLLTALL